MVALNNGDDICAEDLLSVLKKHAGNSHAGSNHADKSQEGDLVIDAATDWSSAQADFEAKLLGHLYPLFPTTRKLAERLKVSHNKIAMKLRQHGIQ